MADATIMKDIDAYFTPEQVNRMMGAAKNERDKLLIKFCWRTGRRISEVLAVKKKDIDFDHGLIRFRILKKKKPTWKLKQIDAGLVTELARYTKNMKPESYIFSSPYVSNQHLGRKQSYNIIRKAAEDSGIFMVGADHHPHPHTLRHSFAIHFLRRCRNPTIALRLLQMMLEHSNLGTTTTYLQFSQEDIRKELDHIFKED